MIVDLWYDIALSLSLIVISSVICLRVSNDVALSFISELQIRTAIGITIVKITIAKIVIC